MDNTTIIIIPKVFIEVAFNFFVEVRKPDVGSKNPYRLVYDDHEILFINNKKIETSLRGKTFEKVISINHKLTDNQLDVLYPTLARISNKPSEMISEYMITMVRTR